MNGLIMLDQHKMKNLIQTVICMIFFGLVSNISQAAPKSELLPQWKQSNEENLASIDHNLWQDILDNYVNTSSSGVNLVAYSKLKNDDFETLTSYVEKLKAIDPRQYNLKEQFAYWVNLYNAATVLLIIENHPISSITKIKDGLFSFGPWDKEWIEVAGETLSLNDIEHRILRPIWNDERIHYAVNCASIGCPNLSKQAFTSVNTEALLEQAATAYINHPRGVNIIDGKLQLSSIFDWYKVDFEKDNSTLIEHINEYANDSLKVQLNSLKGDKFDHDYDWSLNES